MDSCLLSNFNQYYYYFKTVATAPLTTTANCTWIPFNAGEIIACPTNFILTGICDSLNETSCNGSASEAKCCQNDAFIIDDASCQLEEHDPGEIWGCSEVTDGFMSLLGKTCSSLDTAACDGESGVPNASEFTVSSTMLF